MVARKKPPLELAARALCQLRGPTWNTRFNGAPMWHGTEYDTMMVVGRGAVAQTDAWYNPRLPIARPSRPEAQDCHAGAN